MTNFLVPPNMPQASLNPLTPPPLPPNSPSLGFQFWASDPQNNHKVVPSMTEPDAPLQPGMAAANPPKPALMASANPPALSLPDTSAPAFPSLVAPSVVPSGPASFAQDQAANPGKYAKKLVNSGKGAIAEALVAGLAGAAGGLKNDPMAGVKYAQGVQEHDEGIPAQNQALYQNTVVQPYQNVIQQGIQNRQAAANLAKTEAETANLPMKTQALFAKLGMRPETDEHGDITFVPDENSPVYKQMQQKEETLQAQADYTRAGVELRAAQTALANSKNDPNSPAYKQAQQRLAVAQQNANAAGQRAQAYMGRYMQSAYNLGLDGSILPGATQIADDNGSQTVVGTGNASLATKAQSNAAQFNDVHGALDTVENAAKALVAKGGKLNSPGVAAALAQPEGTLGQWLQGEGVKANLSTEERNYVQAVAQAHENIQALRKSAGGTATDSAVAKLDSMIPNASTPDLNYLLGQTGQIRATAERLGKGVSTAKGGLTVRGQNPMVPPSKGGVPAGATHTAPGSDGKMHYTDGKNDLGVVK